MQTPPVKVVVPIPYHMPGNSIEYLPVEFEIFQFENHFRAVPLCGETTKRLAHLPETINFEFVKGRVVIQRTGLKDIAHNIIKTLSSQRLLRLR